MRAWKMTQIKRELHERHELDSGGQYGYQNTCRPYAFCGKPADGFRVGVLGDVRQIAAVPDSSRGVCGFDIPADPDAVALPTVIPA